MDRKQLILQPSPALLDQALLTIIDLNNDYLYTYSTQQRFLDRYEGEVNKLLQRGEEKHRTKAEARVQIESEKAYQDLRMRQVKKREQEINLAQAKMNYYHARSKLSDHSEIDANAAYHGEQFN